MVRTMKIFEGIMPLHCSHLHISVDITQLHWFSESLSQADHLGSVVDHDAEEESGDRGQLRQSLLLQPPEHCHSSLH